MSNETLGVARLGTVDYVPALEIQEALVGARMRDEIKDTLLLLEHPHVYTLGRGGDQRYVAGAGRNVPVHRVSRGGQATYHGPGQLLAYPILRLEGSARDVHKYLRALEDVMLSALGRCGIRAERRPAYTGVWAGGGKVGSIGVGIRRWVTLHGFAINVSPDLSFFDAIVPCGIEGCVMTSIAALGHPEVTVADFADLIERSFALAFGYSCVERMNPAEIPGRDDFSGGEARRGAC